MIDKGWAVGPKRSTLAEKILVLRRSERSSGRLAGREQTEPGGDLHELGVEDRRWGRSVKKKNQYRYWVINLKKKVERLSWRQRGTRKQELKCHVDYWFGTGEWHDSLMTHCDRWQHCHHRCGNSPAVPIMETTAEPRPFPAELHWTELYLIQFKFEHHAISFSMNFICFFSTSFFVLHFNLFLKMCFIFCTTDINIAG